MTNIETTSMSSRGQIVIPQNVRESLDLKEGEKFVVIGNKDTILLKKISMPSFAEITNPLKEAAKKAGLKEEDTVDMVHRFRKQKKK